MTTDTQAAPSAIRVFTDGACLGTFGGCPGGWAALIVAEGEERVLTGRDPSSTNNVMEMTAAIRALEAVPPGSRLALHSESKILIRGLSEWVHDWKARGWRKAPKGKRGKGAAIANLALWQRLHELERERVVRFVWLPAHAGYPENERVDGLAREEARKAAAESGWTPEARSGSGAEAGEEA